MSGEQAFLERRAVPTAVKSFRVVVVEGFRGVMRPPVICGGLCGDDADYLPLNVRKVKSVVTEERDRFCSTMLNWFGASFVRQTWDGRFSLKHPFPPLYHGTR